jgi:hypothetical protein
MEGCACVDVVEPLGETAGRGRRGSDGGGDALRASWWGGAELIVCGQGR